MQDKLEEVFEKLNYIKSEDYAKQSREKATRVLIRKIDKMLALKMKEAFLAGFLISKEGFNGQIPYSADKFWFEEAGKNAGIKIQGLLIKTNNDLAPHYLKFINDDLWYQKILTENKIDIGNTLIDGSENELSFLTKAFQA